MNLVLCCQQGEYSSQSNKTAAHSSDFITTADRTASSLHFTIKIQQSLKLHIIQKPSIGWLKMIHMK